VVSDQWLVISLFALTLNAATKAKGVF
jgi:hypothetical protein